MTCTNLRTFRFVRGQDALPREIKKLYTDQRVVYADFTSHFDK